ncbi:MAG: ArnT family glycosyltransferase [Anaerolineae bacterium]
MTKTADTRHYAWLLLILLAAVWLRLHAITGVPPGLTHDEADHGNTAWEIVRGARAVYFTIGYGREPLYDYSTAALMTFLGPTYLAARVAAVFMGLLLIAGMVRWVRLAYGRQTALLTAAGLSLSFWPVMTARHALRSVTLPALFVLAACLFWRGLRRVGSEERITGSSGRGLRGLWRPATDFLAAGLILGLTMYTYIPARVLWFIFPVAAAFLFMTQPSLFKPVWPGVAWMLAVMIAASLPLISYLAAHADAEVRIRELSQPLTAAAARDFGPLLHNSAASLRLFTVAGDTAWRYNIAGRPLFQPVMGGLFYLGLALAVSHVLNGIRRKKQGGGLRPAAALFALAWLVAGFSPVLVTGPELSSTQAIGMQPVLYLFPALALVTIGRLRFRGRTLGERRFAFMLPLALYAATAVLTARDYFIGWANQPQVRVQYESTMTAAMRYLNENGAGAAAVSTITPGRFHTPALAQMMLRNESVRPRWFDARGSLLLPSDAESLVILPGFTPVAPALNAYFAPAVLVETLPLRPTDEDRPLRIYRVDRETLLTDWETRFIPAPAGPVRLDDALTFLGYDLQTTAVSPGQPVRLATLWRIERPLADGMLFTHIQGADGAPIAQADQLDVPSDGWIPGDVFIQLHEFQLPPDTAAGDYPVVVGVYTQHDRQRLPVLQNGEAAGDLLRLTTLHVIP